MTANPILLQKKYTRIVALYAGKYGMSLTDALDLFYHSEVYQLMSHGIADMHCMSDEYLVEELHRESEGCAGELPQAAGERVNAALVNCRKR